MQPETRRRGAARPAVASNQMYKKVELNSFHAHATQPSVKKSPVSGNIYFTVISCSLAYLALCCNSYILFSFYIYLYKLVLLVGNLANNARLKKDRLNSDSINNSYK